MENNQKYYFQVNQLRGPLTLASETFSTVRELSWWNAPICCTMCYESSGWVINGLFSMCAEPRLSSLS